LPFDSLVREDLVHVGAEDAHIELIVNTTTINGILQNTINLLPLGDLSSSILGKLTEDLLSGFQITVRELVVFDPALRNVCSSFLQDGMEPGKNKQHLDLNRTGWLFRSHILESTSHVVSHTRRSLISDFERTLEQDGRELIVRFTGQEETELLIGGKRLELFFKNCKPGSDQMQVL
jgi:hypothetical protein